MKENIMGELKQRFRPEFLNRIDDIIVFHSLNENHISKNSTFNGSKTTREIKRNGYKIRNE